MIADEVTEGLDGFVNSNSTDQHEIDDTITKAEEAANISIPDPVLNFDSHMSNDFTDPRVVSYRLSELNRAKRVENWNSTRGEQKDWRRAFDILSEKANAAIDTVVSTVAETKFSGFVAECATGAVEGIVKAPIAMTKAIIDDPYTALNPIAMGQKLVEEAPAFYQQLKQANELERTHMLCEVAAPLLLGAEDFLDGSCKCKPRGDAGGKIGCLQSVAIGKT